MPKIKPHGAGLLAGVILAAVPALAQSYSRSADLESAPAGLADCVICRVLAPYLLPLHVLLFMIISVLCVGMETHWISERIRKRALGGALVATAVIGAGLFDAYLYEV